MAWYEEHELCYPGPYKLTDCSWSRVKDNEYYCSTCKSTDIVDMNKFPEWYKPIFLKILERKLNETT